MDGAELRRLIVRHRHVAPMLSVLLAGTDARLRISDADGGTVLDRQVGSASADAPVERHAIALEGVTIGWVEGPRRPERSPRSCRTPWPGRPTSARSPVRRSTVTAS